ncbi:GntP family permease [Pseudonocardia xinjiangensis]|uniref:GntP family permease n=1 Tax=Pseudonocardia xinjiangensis TaxID=75289 RepID=A0ABX1RCK9_9PSEU|nr:gluconate:H+ symporter [Pseudonocardia xinjiangensis]NMH78123.1 GntP family permease [Pseudonocardia xinjiangensis]
MNAFVHWLQHDTAGLLTLAVLSVAVLLLLIIKVKLEPFIALIVVGVLVALAAGVPIAKLVGTPIKSSDSLLETGFGSILGHIAPIIGLGTVLGAIMERSGGADVLTTRLLKLFGPKGAPLAMGLTGVILGIPVFFDIGIFVLAPLVYVAAKRGGRSLVLYAMPMLAGLSMTHAFLPPHPGPVAAAGLLGVDLGWLIIMGLVCGIPAWLVSGVWWGSYIGRRVLVDVPDEFVPTEPDSAGPGNPEKDGPDDAPAGGVATAVRTRPPSVALISSVILLPMVLILGATVGTVALHGGPAQSVLVFLGTPTIALTVAVLVAMYLLGVRRGIGVTELGRLTGESLKPIGMILLVVGAGSFFGAVLRATGVGEALAGSMTAGGLPVIVSAYLISSALRLAQGSATVAIVTTAGIIEPIVTAGGYSHAQIALIVISVSAGSIIASHVNDGGFWIVAKYFNMSVKDTLKTWTVLETILSVVGFAMAVLVWQVV